MQDDFVNVVVGVEVRILDNKRGLPFTAWQERIEVIHELR